MSSLTVHHPQVNGNRQRKPLLPVNVRAYFVVGASRRDVLDGAAVLSITTVDDTDRDESAYWCLAVFGGDRCTGFRLTNFGGGEVYDLPRDLSSYDCPDRKTERDEATMQTATVAAA